MVNTRIGVEANSNQPRYLRARGYPLLSLLYSFVTYSKQRKCDALFGTLFFTCQGSHYMMMTTGLRLTGLVFDAANALLENRATIS
jgi:hypothetical protein